MNMLNKAAGIRSLRVPLLSVVGAASLFATIATSALAAEHPKVTTDWFTGAALIPSGQTSPVQVNPHDVTLRADGAVGIGYTYRASGEASGQLPGPFTYEEHGYLYFRNPADPTTLAGTRFSSGVFTLVPRGHSRPIEISDVAPDKYVSGVKTLNAKPGPLSYGYFTFTDAVGTFTGFATPDFTRFAIQITFPLPV